MLEGISDYLLKCTLQSVGIHAIIKDVQTKIGISLPPVIGQGFSVIGQGSPVIGRSSSVIG